MGHVLSKQRVSPTSSPTVMLNLVLSKLRRSVSGSLFQVHCHRSLFQVHSFRFTLSGWLLQAILRQVHRMTPKWPWTLQGQWYVVLVSRVFPFQPISLCGQPFSVYRPFSEQCTERSQITLNLQGHMYPIDVLLLSPSSNISVCFTLRPAVLELQAILRQGHRINPTLQGQIYPPHMCY